MFPLYIFLFHNEESGTKGHDTAENDPANGDEFIEECNKNSKQAKCCAAPLVVAFVGLAVGCQDAVGGDDILIER